MKYQELPAHVRRFLLTSIPSVPYLEAMLLLRGGRRTAWTAADVGRRIYVPESVAADLLASLASAGIAERSEAADAFTYQPASDELARLLDEVARLYSTNLVAVTDVIHSRIDRRAQQFADAFRWRKDS
jgi:glycerol-3-phosphate O-acyltransferase